MTKKIQDLLKSFIQGIFILYFFVSSIVALPYYNWRYAKENGFVKWLLLGEIVASLKSMIWPYYVFWEKDTKKDSNLSWSPELNSDETERLSKVLHKSDSDELNNEDLSIVRSVLTDYFKRTNSKITKDQFESFEKMKNTMSDYYNLYGKSLLASWDNKKYTEIGNFRELYNYLRENKLRKEELLDLDLKRITIASQNVDYFEDNGIKYQFGREMILKGLKNSEMGMKNMQKILSVYKEFTE